MLAGDEFLGRAGVPSGASTGKFEAVELRDGGKRYGGLGVRRAVDHVNARIAHGLVMNVLIRRRSMKRYRSWMEPIINQILVQMQRWEFPWLRQKLRQLRFGRHFILLGRHSCGKDAGSDDEYLKWRPPCRQHIGYSGIYDYADRSLLLSGRFRMCVEIYHILRGLLKEQGYGTAVGDEGGFAPDLSGAKEALRFLVKAVETAGYQPGKEVGLALDVAASELYDLQSGKYVFEGEGKRSGNLVARTAAEMADYYEELANEFPLLSIEDPLDEEDWEGWKMLTARLGSRLQLVGDDLFVTNTRRLKKGIEWKAANAILIKVNQIGTLTEAIEAIEMAKRVGYQTIISHRSGRDSGFDDCGSCRGISYWTDQNRSAVSGGTSGKV